jgi:hypothetical protein
MPKIIFVDTGTRELQSIEYACHVTVKVFTTPLGIEINLLK